MILFGSEAFAPFHERIETEEFPMKKRAVLFLLVLCAALSLAMPAMAAKKQFISSDLDDAAKLQRYKTANESNDTIEMMVDMYGVDMTTGDWVLNTRMELGSDMVFEPNGLTIGENGTLAKKTDVSPVVACNITNYGTIESGTYTGTITNYGTIIGGTFTGTVINANDGTHQGTVPATETQAADLSKAQIKIKDAGGNLIDGKDDTSFAGAYIEVNLKLASDESIGEHSNTTLPLGKILRGSSIETAMPTRDGDRATTSTVFAYWRKDGSTGTDDIYTHDYFNAPGSQITVTPVWCDHLVKFEVNAPTGAVLLNDRMLPMAFYKNEGKVLSQNKFVCCLKDTSGRATIGQRFLCWNTYASGDGLNYPEETWGLMSYTPDYNADQTETIMYARWVDSRATGSTHTIIYQRDATGSDTHSQTYQTYFASYELLENMFTPERGKQFAGWKVQGIEHPELFQPGQSILIVQQTLDSKDTTKITAQWQSLPVTEITFDANGADVTGATEKETYFKGETLPLPKNSFSREGYTFTGWNTKADGTGTGYGDGANITIEGDTLVGKNVTLYAQWKSNVAPATPTMQPASSIPQTGDESNLALWLALCMVSAAALIVMKKRRFSQR